MVTSQKILSAARSNWWLNALGMVFSFCASVVLVRTLTPELYAQYAAVLAMVWLAALVLEAGANSGLTRYMAEAGQAGARGSFYRAMQRRRWLIALILGGAFIALGPFYARQTNFASLAEQPGLFVLIALIVAASLTRALAHYGLLALFETRRALLWEQAFLVSRAALLASIALLGGGLWHLVAGLLAIAILEAVSADFRLWRFIAQEYQPLPEGFIQKAQAFGLLTILDKACAALGSGPVLLLVLAPFHPPAELAFLALAIDLSGKLISLTVMPMGNLVSPYLSQVSSDPAAQGLAIARVVKLSSLLYCFSIGAGMLIIPAFVPFLYGTAFEGTVAYTLVLLVPVALENWVRGCCSPALLRNGLYKELGALNLLQAAATLTAIVLVLRQPLIIAVAAVTVTRAAAAVLSLLAVRRLAASQTFLVPFLAAAIAGLAAGLGWLAGELAPLSPPLSALAAAAAYALLFFFGVRLILLYDADILDVIRRLAGPRSRTFNWFLPAPSLSNS